MITPTSRPKQSERRTAQILTDYGIRDAVALLAVRAYYLRSMGDPDANDRGLYDDAIFLVSPSAYMAFNANTDPSIQRAGVAVLSPGVWRYTPGTHGLSKPRAQRYRALVQADEVTVIRDGRGPDTGMFGINIHRGGTNTTSSLGCQTIPPAQWPAFMPLVDDQLARYGQKTLPYVLIERTE